MEDTPRQQNISWKAHAANKDLYGPLPLPYKIIKRRRLDLLCLATMNLQGKVMLWTPEEPKRVGRPNTMLNKVPKDSIGLEVTELQKAMLNRVSWWKNYVISAVTDAD